MLHFWGEKSKSSLQIFFNLIDAVVSHVKVCESVCVCVRVSVCDCVCVFVSVCGPKHTLLQHLMERDLSIR